MRAQARDRYHRDPEKKLEISRKWHKANPTRSRELSKSYYETHKQEISVRNALWAKNNQKKKILTTLRFRAKKEGLPFNLIVDDVIIPQVCPVLGITITYGKDAFTKLCCPSADKIIPHLGYVKGNVKWISLRANLIKSNAKPEEVLKVYEYMIAEQHRISNEPLTISVA